VSNERDLDLVQGDTAGAQDALLTIEKQCRLAEDMKLSQDACTALLDVLQAAGDWKGLLEHITMLTKRRGQLKSTIQVRY
jgi:26S proteasome regulatory subunit N5